MGFPIFTSEGFVVSTFRKSEPLVGQDGDFQQCGMYDQQSLRSACAYAQSDQSLLLVT